MKELIEVAKEAGVESGFLGIGKFEKAGAPIAQFAIASGAMAAGITGKIIKLDYEEILGGAAPLLTADQIVQSAQGPVLIQKHLDANGKQNRRKAPTIVFDNGRSMTLGLLLQGQTETTIALRNASGNLEVLKGTDFVMNGDGLNYIGNLLGRTLKCESTWKSKTIEVTRNNPGQEPVKYAANAYTFVEV